MAGGNNQFLPGPSAFHSEEQYSAYGGNFYNSYPVIGVKQGLNHLYWQQFSVEQQSHASSSRSPSSSRPITPTEASPSRAEQERQKRKVQHLGPSWATTACSVVDRKTRVGREQRINNSVEGNLRRCKRSHDIKTRLLRSVLRKCSIFPDVTGEGGSFFPADYEWCWCKSMIFWNCKFHWNFGGATKTKNWKLKTVCQNSWPPKIRG